MLLSETCMLASQDSSSNKRVCSDSQNSNVNLYMHAEAYASIDNDHQCFMQYSPKNDMLNEDTLFEYSSSHSSIDDYNEESYDCNPMGPCNNDGSSVTSHVGSIRTLPVESDLFHHAFMPEEHFMIYLCNTCVGANVPLDLVDKIVHIIRDAQNNGLNIDSDIVRSREYFLKHLSQRFKVPPPETVTMKIEDSSGNNQSIEVIQHNFLTQAMDLIHDHEIWGDEKNFLGTVCMEEPYNPLKYGQSDNKVDEVVDGFWYKETV